MSTVSMQAGLHYIAVSHHAGMNDVGQQLPVQGQHNHNMIQTICEWLSEWIDISYLAIPDRHETHAYDYGMFVLV